MHNDIVALIGSFLGMLFVALSYFVKNKRLYLLFQALCIVFLIVSYFFTAQFFAMIGLAIGLVRALVFFGYERKQKTAPLWVAILLSVCTVAAFFTVNFGVLGVARYEDILCLTALVLYAFIFRIRNLQTVRFAMLVPTVLSIWYNTIIKAALFASLTYVFELTADVVSIFKYHIINKVDKVNKATKEKTKI